MTSMSGSRAPEGDENRPPAAEPSEQDSSPGVELGMSDGTGGTFEPEEDPDGDSGPDS